MPISEVRNIKINKDQVRTGGQCEEIKWKRVCVSESEVTKMAKVSLTKTKPQSSFPLPVQHSFVSSQKSCTFSFLSLSLFFCFSLPPRLSFRPKHTSKRNTLRAVDGGCNSKVI